jgi:putative ABC transport system permease protein
MGQRPGATAVALLTIALGIGANVTVFSLINGTLLSPPPHVDDPEELVLVYHAYEGTPMLIPYPRFVAYRERNEAFDSMASYAQVPLHLRSGDRAERVTGALVSGDFFRALGVEAARGRVIGPEDDQTPGAHPVAVISHSLWRTRFGGRPDVAGMELAVNGHPFTVIGVAPRGFRGLEVGDKTDVWVPAAMQKQAMARDSDLLSHPLMAWSNTFARLRDGVDEAAAEERMTALAAALQEQQVSFGGDSVLLFGDIWVSPYLRGDLVEFNRILAVVVGVVLLLASANVANLMLAEALRRRDEIATRVALGATRWRLVRQLTAEGFLLAAFGSAGGLLLAAGATRLLGSFELWPQLSLADVNLSIDARVLAATVALALVAGVLFALLPALQAASAAGARPTGGGVRGGKGAARMRGALVVLQVTASFALLVGAGLLVRTLIEIGRIDLGFRGDEVATFVVDLELEGHDQAAAEQVYGDILRRLRQVPGVVSASATDLAPFTPVGFLRSSGATFAFLDGGRVPEGLEGRAGPDGRILVGMGSAAPGYLETLGIPLVAGRRLDDRDGPGGAAVVMVSETLAETFWPGENPIGKTFQLDGGVASGFSHDDAEGRPLVEVVGVFGDVKTGNPTGERWQRLAYRPLAQSYQPALSFVVRTSGDPRAWLRPIREAVAAVDPDLVVYGLETMQDRVDRSLGERRLTTNLLVAFGALALLLAAVGLYGVLAHSVSRRTREIGVRVAVGAGRADLLALVFRGGLRLVAIGMVAGIPAAWGLSRIFASTRYGVSTFDPGVFALATLTLLAASVLACSIPALRATRIDAVTALRRE